MEKLIISLIIIALIAFLYFRFNGNFNGNNEAAEKNIAIGMEFLAVNKLKEGMIETASGLQYLVLKQGEGDNHPGPKDKVTVHYHGSLLDGTVFDSSVDRGKSISFSLNQVIPGWTEGVQLMMVGEKTKFFIPSKLAYGNRSTGKIEAGSLLIFEVELIAVE